MFRHIKAILRSTATVAVLSLLVIGAAYFLLTSRVADLAACEDGEAIRIVGRVASVHETPTSRKQVFELADPTGKVFVVTDSRFEEGQWLMLFGTKSITDENRTVINEDLTLNLF